MGERRLRAPGVTALGPRRARSAGSVPVRRDAAGPVSRDQASDGVGVARHTAKFHLDKLVDEGLLTTEFRRLTGRSGPGAGRPTKLYSRSAQEVAVSVPERHYALAGQLMARAIDDAARNGTDVVTALRDAAAQHGRSLGGKAADTAGPEPAAPPYSTPSAPHWRRRATSPASPTGSSPWPTAPSTPSPGSTRLSCAG